MNNALPQSAEVAYILSGGNTALEISQDQSFKIEKLSADPSVESVNNYFKSMKEIEAEFLTSMNTAKSSLRNMISELGHFSQHVMGLDGINYPDSDDLRNRYMEENY